MTKSNKSNNDKQQSHEKISCDKALTDNEKNENEKMTALTDELVHGVDSGLSEEEAARIFSEANL